ncbi:MAG TPA: hypothetical protein VGD98_18715 [Ktedonobacteraceae bacterium]
MNKKEGNVMSDPRNVKANNVQPTPAEASRLTERPERRGGRRVGGLLFILCGCLLLLAGAGVLVWQLTLHAGTTPSASSGNTPTSSNKPVKQPTGCTSAREPVNVIQQQTAQGLHLTVAQVQARVLAGKTIAQIATAQGLTAAQLHTVEIQALQSANQRWLDMGCITQQDVQDNLKRDTGSAAYMDEEFTGWFKG